MEGGVTSRVNGRQKGARAELEVAALIQTWWSRREPDVIVKRTPGSGGWASPDARAVFRTAGDLVISSTKWPWSVEIKRREAWSLERLCKGGASPVWGWWRQAGEQAREMDLRPMLWFRRSHAAWLVMLSLDDPALALLDRGRVTISWTPGEHARIPHGGAPAIVFEASRVLAIDPRRMFEDSLSTR
jgi:hypothetical protein